MSEFKIDCPGFYRQRNGGKAEVLLINDVHEYAIGFMPSDVGVPQRWTTAGEFHKGSYSSPLDLVARWPRFAVGDRVRVKDACGLIRYATVTRHSNVTHFPYMVEDGSWSAWMDESELVPDERPAPEEPKPFRISDHGLGVYETRDGREASIVGIRDGLTAYPWNGRVGSDWTSWTNEGKYACTISRHSADLVRYIGPLPKSVEPEQWVPTCEDRYVYMGLYTFTPISEEYKQSIPMWFDGRWHFVRHERKFTCGDKSEWRPIPVEVPEWKTT